MFGSRHLTSSIEDARECQRLAAAAVASMAQVMACLRLMKPPMCWPELFDDLGEIGEEAAALYERLQALAVGVEARGEQLKAEAEAKRQREGNGRD